MQLIIVQGQTATGKTTLVKKLAQDLDLPFCLKDDLKEQSYESLLKAPSLKQWLKIEDQSWQQLYETVAQAIKADKSLIIEGDFRPPQRRALDKLLTDKVAVVEIYCWAKGREVIKRFKRRNRQEGRHQGHRDNLWLPLIYLAAIAGVTGWRWNRPLRLSDRTLVVDTSDFAKVDYGEIEKYVAASGTIG